MKKNIDIIMSSILNISLALFVMGIIFQIQHWAYGNLMAVIGLGSYLIMSIIEITRLKKIIVNLQKDDIKA
jgi:hypothetical protein